MFPVTTPSPGIDWTKNGIAVAVPSNGSPKKLLPQGHNPVKGMLENYLYMNSRQQQLILLSIDATWKIFFYIDPVQNFHSDCEGSLAFNNKVPSLQVVSTYHTFTFNSIS